MSDSTTIAWRGDSERNRFVNNKETLVSIAQERHSKSWLVIDDREDPPALYRHATFLVAMETATGLIETHGEGAGHAFRGNQHTGGISGIEGVGPNKFALGEGDQLGTVHRGQVVSARCSMDSMPPGKATELKKWLKTEGLTPEKIEYRYRALMDMARGTDAWERGVAWYPGVNEWVGQKAAEHGSTVQTVAGVISAMSPGMKWEYEQPIADLMLAAANGKKVSLPASHVDDVIAKLIPDEKVLGIVRSGGTFRELHEANPSAATLILRQQFQAEGKGGWAVGYGYDNFESALSVAMGKKTPDQALTGIKTRSFYNNIIDPYGSRDVTSDVLMAEAAQNSSTQSERLYSQIGSSKVGVDGGKSVKYGIHPVVSDIVRKIGDSEGLPPSTVQAIIWSQWRKMHSAFSKKQKTEKAAKVNQDKVLAANLQRSINQAKRKKALAKERETHAAVATGEQIPVVVEFGGDEPLYPEWFYEFFLSAETLEDQIAVLDAAAELGLLPKSTETHGEGPGHPFRGNQYVDGTGSDGPGGESPGSKTEVKPSGGGSGSGGSGGSSRLSPREEKLFKEAKEKFEADLKADPEGMVRRYFELKDAMKDGSFVINPDVANDLSSHYAENFEDKAMLSAAVNETAIKVAKLAYEHALKQPRNPGHVASVLITAGGSGAGKSYGIDNLEKVKAIASKAHIVVDGMGGGGAQLQGPELAEYHIETAKRAGFSTTITNVFRDPVEAYINGVVPRGLVEGRMTTAKEAVQGHIQNNKSIHHLMKKYADDSTVSFHFVESGLEGVKLTTGPKPIDFFSEKKLVYEVATTLKTPSTLSQKFRKSVERMKAKIKDSKVYENALKGIIPSNILNAALTGIS